MTSDANEAVAHCPNCLAEYRAGFDTCSDCGVEIVPGPAPAEEEVEEPGELDLGAPSEEPEGEEDVRVQEASEYDQFEAEEHPTRVELCRLYEEDVDELVKALDREGIGVRIGDRDEDDGAVAVVVHDFRLPEAQAVLNEFLGDEEPSPVSVADDDGYVSISSTSADDAWLQGERLRAKGIDVKLVSREALDAHGRGLADLLVPQEDADEAREILHIVT